MADTTNTNVYVTPQVSVSSPPSSGKELVPLAAALIESSKINALAIASLNNTPSAAPLAAGGSGGSFNNRTVQLLLIGVALWVLLK